MIVRMWRGWVERHDAQAYDAYLAEVALPAYRAASGNRGAWVLHRPEGEREEFVTVSLWGSLDDVRGFAGEDFERAVFYARDDEFLVDRDWWVAHYLLTDAGCGSPETTT